MGAMADEPTTTYYRIGSESNRPITPIGITSAQLVDGLRASGVRLIAFGDGEHTSTEVTRQFNKAMEGAKQPLGQIFLERRNTEQPLVDAYLKDGSEKSITALKAEVIPDDDAHAPDKEDQRKDYFAQGWKPYEIAKAKKMGVSFVDAYDKDKHGPATDLGNELLRIERRFALISKMVADGETDDDKKAGKTLGEVLKKDDDALKTLAAGVEAGVGKRFKIYKGETVSTMSKEELKTFFKDFVESFPAPKSGTKDYAEYTFSELKDMVQTQYTLVEAKEQAAKNVRDIWRDEQMANGVTKGLVNDGTGAMLIGMGHYGNKAEGRTEPNLEERLRKELGDAMVRVDIIPVSSGSLDVIAGKEGLKELVTVGGRQGADYTIFVADDNVQYSMGPSKAPEGATKEETAKIAVDKDAYDKRVERSKKFAEAEKKEPDTKMNTKKEREKGGSGRMASLLPPDWSGATALAATGNQPEDDDLGGFKPDVVKLARPKGRINPFEMG